MTRAVQLSATWRWKMGNELVRIAQAERVKLLTIAVASQHVHMLVELPTSLPDARRQMGRIKMLSSYAVRLERPGRIWASGGKFIRIENRRQQRTVFEYVVRHRESGAWVWTFRDEAPAEGSAV